MAGIVQGVGFRPFIYRIAVKASVKGYVKNLGGSEVEIWAEGSPLDLSRFLELLVLEKPPPALIEYAEIEEVKPRGYECFSILKSGKSMYKRSMIPPDIAICSECLKEIHDPSTRFYKYYWNSCAWCGPRFSMMYRVPYDRCNTAMNKYKLCSDCRHDYEDPNNIRRFHAQGISCPKCGPRTRVYTNKGEEIKVDDPVEFTANVIEEGAIVAIKGVGGFHIACLASDDKVVYKLRVRKRRPRQPFALMARDISVASKLVVVDELARRILESPQRPIVILPKRRGAPVSDLVAPNLTTLGVMLPYTGFQQLLLEKVRDGFLIMTSGNKHGRPMCTSLECVITELSDVVDYIVAHDRDIVHRVDDSVVRFTDGEPVIIRRARGYAPTWLRAPFKLVESVALGAELQTCGAIAFEDKIVPTQFIGDLDEPGQLSDLEKELRWFIEVYNLKPKLIVLDRHPFYANRRLGVRMALEYDAELIEVQHHHAHAAQVMVEYGVELGEERVVLTIDGVGYGDDHTIWGGEVLVASYSTYERVGRLHVFPLPGGDLATLYPFRSLIGLLYSCGWSIDELMEIVGEEAINAALPRGVEEAITAYHVCRQPTTPRTSSMGRTLDAFSALLGLCYKRTYEGEPAIVLEAKADNGRDLGYTPPIRKTSSGIFEVDTCSLLNWVIENLKRVRVSDIASTILHGLGRALGEIMLEHADKDCFASGGAAVNTYIIRGVRQILSSNNIKLLLPRKIPPNDGGIPVGQIVVASAQSQ